MDSDPASRGKGEKGISPWRLQLGLRGVPGGPLKIRILWGFIGKIRIRERVFRKQGKKKGEMKGRIVKVRQRTCDEDPAATMKAGE